MINSGLKEKRLSRNQNAQQEGLQATRKINLCIQKRPRKIAHGCNKNAPKRMAHGEWNTQKTEYNYAP